MISVFRRPILAATLLFGAGLLSAAETDYELSIGGTYSDNVSRGATLEEDETISFIGLGMNVSHESKRVEIGLLSDLKFNHYLDDSYDDEVTGALNADFEFLVLPEVLSWVATDRFGNLQTDPFRADTVDNRGNFNSFSTGPDLTLKLGNRTSFLLGGRLEKNDIEERDTDNDVVSGDVVLSRALNSNRSISISFTWDDVDYREVGPQLTDYQRASAYATFNSQISKGLLSISAGTNEVETLDQTLDGTLLGVSFSRELTARASLRLGYEQDYSNSWDIFRGFQTPGQSFGETQDIPGDGEPFESRRFSAGLDFRQGRADYFLSLLSTEEIYESNNALGRRRIEFRLGFSRELGSDWDIAADGRFSRSDYKDVVREDDDFDASLSVSRRLGRTLYLQYGYVYADRSSTGGASNYTENRHTLMLRFDPE